jgi:YidC/Oxa1 family membrane protein insertase
MARCAAGGSRCVVSAAASPSGATVTTRSLTLTSTSTGTQPAKEYRVLNPLSEAIGWLLAVFYSVIPNLGICIILLTCAVMLVLFPLTAKQARSMIAMQRVQPEIKKLQAKYKDDRQKQNEEIMRFYQENKINPLSGCFPLLMQMPVFIALFGLLRHMQKFIPTTGKFSDLFHDICGNAATSKACTNPKGLHFLSMDLSVAPAKASTVANGFVATLPYFIMVALVIATGWYQAHQTMQRQAKSGTSAMNSQAQIIGRVMPIAFGLISLNFASGLIVYFVTSNLWRIGQQQLVLNKFYDQPAPSAKVVDEKPEREAPASGARSSGAGATGSRREGRASPGTTPKNAASTATGNSAGNSAGEPAGAATPAARARPNPNTAQRKKKRKR